MANFVDSNITHAGDLAIARVLAGEQLTFTKIELGDGRMPTGSLAADMTALVSTKAVVDIVKCEPETDGTAVVGGVFVNTFTPEGFEWRELGLFADVGDGEFLFSYGNAGDFCDYIPGSGGGTVVEKVIDVFTYVGDKANVTALIRADSYATVEQYLALKEEIQAAAEEADSARQSAILAAGTATSAATAANDAAARAEEGEAARIADEEERAAAEEDRALAELDRADEEARRQAEFEQIRINAQSIRTVLLSDDQYDPVSRTLLIEGEQGVTYYIPSDDPQENNVYVEWQYLLRTDGTEAWEMFGRGSTVPDAITAADIDAVCDGGTEPVGTRTLTLTGFKYLIQKLRGVFAGIAHKHSATDITSGTLNAARIADGSIGSAKLDAALRECTTQSVNGSRLVAKTVSADKLADKAVTTAKLSDDVWGWQAVGAISDIGTLYRCGRLGFIEVYCKKTAALEGWKNISGTLPGGVRAAFVARSRLTCEDKPDYECTGRVSDNTFYLENRSATNWPASSGFYVTGSLVFVIA